MTNAKANGFAFYCTSTWRNTTQTPRNSSAANSLSIHLTRAKESNLFHAFSVGGDRVAYSTDLIEKNPEGISVYAPGDEIKTVVI